MTYHVWNGHGEVQPGEAYFHKRDGTIVGRPYVRRRVLAYLARHVGNYGDRWAVIGRTVDNDAWLGTRNGYLVAAICRDAWRNYYEN